MPELPEVETVKEALKKKVLNKRIMDVKIYYPNIIEYPMADEFKNRIINQKINDIKRRGKWLVFELDDDYLLSHLRMEGKYNIVDPSKDHNKHEHISFLLDNNQELRYQDTRKFGKMHLIEKDQLLNRKPLNELGLEPWDQTLTTKYLKDKYQNKKLPIKTVILDQSIIVGIGNIYADEILYLSKINPLKEAKKLTSQELQKIIDNTKLVLERAIKAGGTTIRTYSSVDGIHGLFQQELLVHRKEGEPCQVCHQDIIKIKVNGRGTYYCPICQKK
ncbi:MAG: DNA-formamidopyrimidine glycosylase [Bacilli bacterium]|nr:DNA-formamidopyrimidine glycosylase [Bacilli bacterium]MDD4809267.1 DNA-formamidopyrimidine glycosylase [Bacilli bacterium]